MERGELLACRLEIQPLGRLISSRKTMFYVVPLYKDGAPLALRAHRFERFLRVPEKAEYHRIIAGVGPLGEQIALDNLNVIIAHAHCVACKHCKRGGTYVHRGNAAAMRRKRKA